MCCRKVGFGYVERRTGQNLVGLGALKLYLAAKIVLYFETYKCLLKKKAGWLKLFCWY